MSSRKTAPSLRFRGFSEPWEEKKLGEIASVYDGIHQTPNYTDSGIMFLSVENIGTLKSEKYISEEAFYRDYKIYPQNGDILMTRIGDVGTPNVVETKEKIAFYVSLALLKLIGVDSYFLCNFIQSSFFQNGLKERTLVTAIPQKINKDEIGKIDVLVPISLSEQQAIGSYFQNLDHLIALEQQKYDKLNTVKKSMLKKMFPQKGAKVPEIRFKGFSDPWEEKKLGEIMSITSVKRIHQSDWRDSGVRFLRARDIVAASKNEEVDEYLYISKEKYEEYSAISGKVTISDLLVTGVGTIGVPYLIKDLNPVYFKDGNIIWFQNADKIDGNFLLYSFLGIQIQNFIREAAGTGTVGTYTIESGKKTPISLPNKTEQQAIGSYFRNLDHLITSQGRKIEKLRNLKKACLEKMFV